MELQTGDRWQSDDASDDRRLHTGDEWIWQSGDATCTDDRRLHAVDEWQSGDASNDKRLQTEDGWQSDDATDDRKLDAGVGFQSGDANFKHLTTSDLLQDHMRLDTCDKP
jgi:hypothetical protein